MSTTPSSARFGPDRLRNSLLSQGGAQVFKLVVAIGIGGWTARYLGPQNFGTLSYVTALVLLLGPLGSLGVKNSLSAMLCEEKPLPGLLGSAFLIELMGTLVIALVLIPFAWAAKDPVVVGLIGLAVVGNLFNSSEVFEVELLNRHQGTQVARVGTIQTVAGALISVLALLVQAPLLVFGSLPVIQAGIRGYLLATAVKIVGPIHLLNQVTWEATRGLIRRGWPLLLSGISWAIFMKSDQVMLEWLRGPYEVGQYSVAVRIVESLYFLPAILTNTFLPRIATSAGKLESEKALHQLYTKTWFLGLGMSIVSIFVFPPLIPIVFGDKFLPAQSVLTWLGLASFFISMGCASGAWLNVNGYGNLIVIRSAIGAVLNLVLNVVLIPYAGLSGAAASTLVSYSCPVLVMLFHSYETRKNGLYLLYPFRELK